MFLPFTGQISGFATNASNTIDDAEDETTSP